MIARPGKSGPSRFTRSGAALAAAMMLFSASAVAQQPQGGPPAAPAAQAAPPSPPPVQPGIIATIGRWFEESTARVKSHLSGASGTLQDIGGRAGGVAKDAAEVAKDAAIGATDVAKGAAEVAKDTAKGAVDVAKGATDVAKDTAKGAAEAAKEAADAVAKLPRSRVVDGRERCELAPNGAPDCRVAAEAVCKTHGYESGTSMNIQQSQKCPARVWLAGRSPRAGECETVSFVTRAVCQ